MKPYSKTTARGVSPTHLKNKFLSTVRLCLLICAMLPALSFAGSGAQPNILLIYLDDLGYGDFGCTNPDSKIPTPEMDQLAREGILFTDSHSPGSICGPSRYGLLTGRYPWRRGKGGAGNGAKFRDVFIEDGRLTLASLLKRKGYNTAEIGKWGLRHNYSAAVLPGQKPGDLDAYDFEHKKLLGPQLFGFDYTWTLTYLTKQSSDIKTPFENSKPVDPSLTPTDSHTWLPDSADKVIDYLKVFAGKEQDERFGIDADNPFFVYWDPTAPHAPYMPNNSFVGKTKAGYYGDFVYEVDHYVGRILDTLDQLGLSENTLVILSSDNGPDSDAYHHLQKYGHASMGTRRGIKTDAFESGHRLPLIVRWPGVIKANQKSEFLVSMTDWFATFAELTGQKVPNGAGEDSKSLLPILRGETDTPYRDSVIHHSSRRDFAIRQGNWVFVDSSSVPANEPRWFRELRGIEATDDPGQLYNLENDPGQSKNLYSTYPEKARELKERLTEQTENLN